MTTATYRKGAALPDVALVWTDRTGALIDFTSAYTFTVEVIAKGVTTVLAGSTVTGSAGSLATTPPTPNVVVAFTVANLNALTVDVDYQLVVRATRISDSKPRDFPGPLNLHIRNVP